MITDLLLTGVEGIEAIKKNTQDKYTPIIAISSMVTQKAQSIQEQVMTGGASFFFSKPLKLDDFGSCIYKIFNLLK